MNKSITTNGLLGNIPVFLAPNAYVQAFDASGQVAMAVYLLDTVMSVSVSLDTKTVTLVFADTVDSRVWTALGNMRDDSISFSIQWHDSLGRAVRTVTSGPLFLDPSRSVATADAENSPCRVTAVFSARA